MRSKKTCCSVRVRQLGLRTPDTRQLPQKQLFRQDNESEHVSEGLPQWEHQQPAEASTAG